MLALVASAFPHPGALPHLPEMDPSSLAIGALWLVVGTAFCYFAANPSFNAEKSSRSWPIRSSQKVL